jgi:TonB-linked SusC/RagA family outer membrane protein
MRITKPLILLVLLCLTGIAYGQTITGEIIDKSTRSPISAATITGNKSKKSAVSDLNGKFTLELSGDKSLEVSYVGYTTQTIGITSALNYIIELEASNSSLDQVVVVAYGSQKKGNLTGAVTTVDVSKTMQSRPVNDPAKALQGVVPGLTITYSNGGLTAGPGINIRGIGSVSGSSRPLIMVDNVETPDLSIINPNDIESVSVLKDAASTSIYGARAAFGVILIKTKSGRKNQKSSIVYSNNFSWNKPTTLPDFSNPVPELTALQEASQRSNVTNPELFGMRLAKLRDGIANWQQKYANNRKGNEMVDGEDFEFDPTENRMYFYRVWDAKGMMLKDYTHEQQQNIRIQGGSDKIGYYMSFGYSHEDGILKMNPDDVKKYNITASVSAAVTPWMDADVKMLYRNFKYEYPFQYYDYWYYFWRWGSYFPYGTSNGNYFRHTPAYLAQANTNDVVDNYNRIDLGATFKLAKNLNVRVDYTIGRDNVMRHEVGGPVNVLDFWSAGYPKLVNVATVAQDRATYGSGRYLVNTLNAYATYNKTFFNDHNLKVTVGANAEQNENLNFTAERRALLDPDKGELGLATGDQFATGSHAKNSYAGYFGRVNYDYMGKYLLELNGRYDGSSQFSQQDRWAWFSSFSAGYRISEEKFMDPLKPLLSDMKFRVSYGSVGNQDVGGNYYLPTMSNSAASWIVPGAATRVQTIGAPIAVAQSLTWETVKTLDFGTDIKLLDNKLGITFDYYERTTEGMLINTAVPATFGATGPRVNGGSMRNRGWELSIDGNINVTKDLNLYGLFTLADNKAVITKWDNPSKLISQNYQGKVWGEIWGFETEGYFTSAEDVTKHASQVAMANGNFVYGVGDVKYKDQDGNNLINGGGMSANNSGDLKVIGNSTPRYQYSFRMGGTYKGFDLDIFLQGVGKRDYWGTGNIAIPLYQGADILYAHQLDYWTPTNTNAEYPRPYIGNNATKLAGLPTSGNNFYPQTKYLQNLAYCRLKNVTLGYTLPAALTSKYKVQKLRIYVSGQNLAEISNVGLPLDPEITDGGDFNFLGRTFPFERNFSFGLQVTL